MEEALTAFMMLPYLLGLLAWLGVRQSILEWLLGAWAYFFVGGLGIVVVGSLWESFASSSPSRSRLLANLLLVGGWVGFQSSTHFPLTETADTTLDRLAFIVVNVMVAALVLGIAQGIIGAVREKFGL